jgi:hypothetical protein
MRLSASAATRVIDDPRGDSHLGYDLTRTVFHHLPRRISVTAHVVGLQREQAGFRFEFGPVSKFHLIFAARTYLGRDGQRKTLHNLYIRQSDGSAIRVPCDVRASWFLIRNTVSVSVPQACITDEAGPLNMRVLLSRRGNEIFEETRWVHRVQLG